MFSDSVRILHTSIRLSALHHGRFKIIDNNTNITFYNTKYWRIAHHAIIIRDVCVVSANARVVELMCVGNYRNTLTKVHVARRILVQKSKYKIYSDFETDT